MAQGTQATTPIYKVLLLGDEGVGKTSLGKWCQYGDSMEMKEDHATGVYRYELDTSHGLIKFDIWDIPDPVEFAAAKEKYLEDIDAVIIMFDLQNPATYENVPLWFETIPESTRTAERFFPVALCGNKVDLPDRRLGPRGITFHREHGLHYFDITVKGHNNLVSKVFVWIIKRILNDQSLHLMDDQFRNKLQRQNLEDSQYGDDSNVEATGVSPVVPSRTENQETLGFRKELNLRPLANSEVFDLQNLRPKVESMIARLRQVPEITIERVEIAPPSSESEIEEAKKFANGFLPTGVETFYRQIGSFMLEWKYELPEHDTRHIVGHIQILPIGEVFGDNWRDITWFPLPDHMEPNVDDEWRFTYRNVLPFDFFVPEACTCFIQGPDGSKPEDFVAFHCFGAELCRTRYTFAEYIERLLKSYGYFYWVNALCPGYEGTTEVKDFRLFMAEISGMYDEGLFRP